jgi:anti-sigma regulatory factor (Ser/Thr protein kinase)
MEALTLSKMHSVVVAVAEPSQVAEARRSASALATAAGFEAADAGKVALAATEAATNLAKFAQHGELLFNLIEGAAGKGLEMLSVDKGPGIADLDACLRDGHSSSGGPGTGLGALRRLASAFDIYSAVGTGTGVLCRFWPRRTLGTPPMPLQIGAVAVPRRGESVSGDAWAVRLDLDGPSMAVVDGLGHGPLAAEAALKAIAAFRQEPGTPPQMIQRAHGPLRSTRGAAMAVAQVDICRSRVLYAGIGNVTGLISSHGASRYMVSYAGIVGHEMRRIQEFTYHLPADSILVMYSDGLTSRWSMESHPGLQAHDLSLIAGMLYRLYTRDRDDATVLVARIPR